MHVDSALNQEALGCLVINSLKLKDLSVVTIHPDRSKTCFVFRLVQIWKKCP